MVKGCRPCCSLPHGWLSLAVAIIANVGLTMSLITLCSCRFVTVFDDNFNLLMNMIMPGMSDIINTTGMPAIPGMMHINRGFGLMTYENYGSSCRTYNEGWHRFPETLGPMHMAAQAFAILAVVFGLIAMIISWCMCCIALDICFAKGLGISYGCIAVFQGLAFLLFGADLCKKHECAFAGAAGLNIAATFFWAVASLLSFLVPPFDENATGSVLPVTSPPIVGKNLTDTEINEIINAAQSIPLLTDVINEIINAAHQSIPQPPQDDRLSVELQGPAIYGSSKPKSYAEISKAVYVGNRPNGPIFDAYVKSKPKLASGEPNLAINSELGEFAFGVDDILDSL